MKLRELVKELSSKNAGNFSTSFDIVFEDGDRYRRVWSSGVLTRESIAGLFRMPEEDVLSIIPFEPGNAIKINVRRHKPSGDPGETDVFGAQQYAPLLDVEIP
jgi:hypothetical protein